MWSTSPARSSFTATMARTTCCSIRVRSRSPVCWIGSGRTSAVRSKTSRGASGSSACTIPDMSPRCDVATELWRQRIRVTEYLVGVTSSRPSYAMSPVAVSGSHSRTQLSEPVDAVGLIGDAVAPDASAPQTSMHDHVSLGRMVVERYRRHQTVARIRAVAGQDVDMEREQAVRAVVAVAAAGERRDGHAAVGTDERRVLGGSGDGRSSRVEVIFKLERPRVPSALARDRRITAARARRLGWRVTDSPPASRASDYFQFLLHPGLLHPEIRTPAGFVSSLICFRPRFWASHCQEGSPACHR